MSDESNTPVPEPPDAEAQTRIGVDSWVAESEDRQARKRGFFGPAGLPAPIVARLNGDSLTI